MYRALALLETPLINPRETLEKTLEKVCKKLNCTFTYVMQKNYSHETMGTVSATCFAVTVGKPGEYDFKVNYYDKLTLFDLTKVKDLPAKNFTCCIEIQSHKPDPFTDYFNDYLLLCENIEKELHCTIINL